MEDDGLASPRSCGVAFLWRTDRQLGADAARTPPSRLQHGEREPRVCRLARGGGAGNPACGGRAGCDARGVHRAPWSSRWRLRSARRPRRALRHSDLRVARRRDAARRRCGCARKDGAHAKSAIAAPPGPPWRSDRAGAWPGRVEPRNPLLWVVSVCGVFCVTHTAVMKISTTSVQLKMSSPRGRVKTITKTAN